MSAAFGCFIRRRVLSARERRLAEHSTPQAAVRRAIFQCLVLSSDAEIPVDGLGGLRQESDDAETVAFAGNGRISEIGALDANNVHLDAEPPVLVVRDGKWGKDRIVPLHPRLIPMLRGQSGWFFPNGQGGHLKPGAIHNALQFLLVRNGIPRFTFHALRHYFGSEAARWSGGNVVLVAALMGHENTNTTMGYIGWAPTEGAEVVAKITGSSVEDELGARRRRAVSA